MRKEVNPMYDPSDLSVETIRDLCFEQVKRQTFRTIQARILLEV